MNTRSPNGSISVASVQRDRGECIVVSFVRTQDTYIDCRTPPEPALDVLSDNDGDTLSMPSVAQVWNDYASAILENTDESIHAVVSSDLDVACGLPPDTIIPHVSRPSRQREYDKANAIGYCSKE